MFYIYISMKDGCFVRIPDISTFETGRILSNNFLTCKFKINSFDFDTDGFMTLYSVQESNSKYIMESISIPVSDIQNYIIFLDKDEEETNE